MDQGEKTREENKLLRWATSASVLVAFVLLVVKLYAWWVSGSVSVLASLVDSCIDALASIVNFIAVRYALQPADDEHRFGHGKAESLAGLGQSLFIMGSAVFLLIQGVDRMLNPVPLQQVDIALAVMVFSIVVTSVLVLFQKRVIRRTQSVAIQADSLHYVSDLLTNIGIVVALCFITLGWENIDAILAVAISIYIFYSAVVIWNESIQHLLDRELPMGEQKQIETIAASHSAILGVHDLRTRLSGRSRIIQLHLELDANTPLWQAHKICLEVQQNILRVFPGSDILLHQDPYNPEPDRLTPELTRNDI